MEMFHDILELEKDSVDATDFMESVKGDIFSDKVYVFTPKGDVTELPAGSGPLDFAYSIHTQVGDKTTGAKVNGKMVQLDYKLKTGDIVEVITSPNSFGPSRDWLKLVKTTKARNKIKRFFKSQDREQSIQKGRDLVSDELREHGFNTAVFLNKAHITEVLNRFNYKTEDELFAAVGFGEVSPVSLANRLTEKERREIQKEKEKEKAEALTKGNVKVEKEPEKMKIRHDGGIVIQGASNLMIRLSRCCNPVPGDDIVGYITKGRGISIHRRDCQNLANQPEVQERLIEVEWEDTSSSKKDYVAELDIFGFNRSGLLNDVLQVVSGHTKNLVSVDAKPIKDKMAVIHVAVGIKDLSHLTLIVDKIKSIPDIYSVKRTNG
jgi:GTP pyrophosphokinase